MPGEREIGGLCAVGGRIGQRHDRLTFLPEHLFDPVELTAIGSLRREDRAADDGDRGDPADETGTCVHA